jgi:DNA-binding beta-propeller fold protein YncE
VVATVTVRDTLYGVAITPNGSYAYVANDILGNLRFDR